MSYAELITILCSRNVFKKMKTNENSIFTLIPELQICKGFNQNNPWHIYDVYNHILHVIKNVRNDKCLRIAALFHDIGKPLSYKEDNDHVGHFHGHWNESLKIFESYADKFYLIDSEVKLISSLIFYHDAKIDNMSDEELKQMISKIGIDNTTTLFELKKADLLAQSPDHHDLLEVIDQQEKCINILKNEMDTN